MRSKVAEDVRRAQAERERRMSPEERLELLAQANELAIELYSARHRVTREEAAAALVSANKESGRRAQ